jgi:cyclopropane fatty-acyl-phospholipid synthase-like methyltransferase
MDFFDLNDYEFYDGIWACSSILHVKQSRYLEIFKKMRDAIKNDGCMFISFSEGQNEEEYKADGRYFNNINTEKFIYLTNEAELKVVEFGTNLSNVKAHNAPTHNQVIWNSMVLKKKVIG